jgi:hypothetical protein
MNRQPPDAPSDIADAVKPITLAATGTIDLNTSTRVATFECAHPNGLLGKYVAIIPFHMLKESAGTLQALEGKNEAAAKKATEKPKLELHTQ